MRDFKPRIPSSTGPHPASGAIPPSHIRALDRRQGLDQQQRAFRSWGPTPRPTRTRPPA